MATVAVSNALARRLAIEAAEREAVNETEAAANRVDDLLHSIEERTLALGEALSVLNPTPADADRLLRAFVEGNRDLYGAAIAWLPGPRGEHRALYYHWKAEGETNARKSRPRERRVPLLGARLVRGAAEERASPAGPSPTATRAGARWRW